MVQITPKPVALLVAIAIIASVQLPTSSACPFASGEGMAHLRKLSGQAELNVCRHQRLRFHKCDKHGDYGPFSPTFYEDKGCTGGDGLWGTIVKALDSFNHPNDGSSYVNDCLAALIRNVFHMDVGLGHNARMFLEDYGSKSAPKARPDSDPETSRSAKMANPNISVRCYDIYEHLRVVVDKYTASNCPKVYVSCTDLANYAARYAHWKLSNHKFLPCFNFGFADTEPEDFATGTDPFTPDRRNPREASDQCLPAQDSGGVSKDGINAFFNGAMDSFLKPCYPTTVPFNRKDLASIFLGHSFGEGHCSLLTHREDDPFMNVTFSRKLDSDCKKCNAAIEAGESVKPYGPDFHSNLKGNFSFAQKCKTAGMKDFLPAGKTTGIDRSQLGFVGGSPCCVPLDVFTEGRLDFQYYAVVRQGLGAFQIDNGLAVHPSTKDQVKVYSKCSHTQRMLADYQRAWNKMNLIGAKPHDGKRRKHCSVPTWATRKRMTG